MTTFMTHFSNCEHTWYTEFVYPPEEETSEPALVVDKDYVTQVELHIEKTDGTTWSTADATTQPSTDTDLIFLHHGGVTEFWGGKRTGPQARFDKETHLREIRDVAPDVAPEAAVCPCWVNDMNGGLVFPEALNQQQNPAIPKAEIATIELRLHHTISGYPTPLRWKISNKADTVFLNHNGVKTYVKAWHARGGNTTKGNKAEQSSKDRILGNGEPGKNTKRIP